MRSRLSNRERCVDSVGVAFLEVITVQRQSIADVGEADDVGVACPRVGIEGCCFHFNADDIGLRSGTDGGMGFSIWSIGRPRGAG